MGKSIIQVTTYMYFNVIFNHDLNYLTSYYNYNQIPIAISLKSYYYLKLLCIFNYKLSSWKVGNVDFVRLLEAPT